jgi:mono/diheme cytochrome c family protein
MASMQLRMPAALLALALVAGCGGDRSRVAAGADTSGSAVVRPDSTAMPVADTGRPAADTARRSTSDTAPADSGKKLSSVPKAAPTPKPQPKKIAAARPRPSRDTTARQTTAATANSDTSGKSAPAPAAPTPAAQDTGKAAAAAAAAAESGGELRDAYHQAPRDTVNEATYDGWKQFNLNCARCHGEDVLGTTIAPHLILSLKPDGPINTKELFVQTVCAGRPAKGMPAWCALGLDMGKINDIYLYVKGRSDAKIGPGRPAVKQGS